MSAAELRTLDVFDTVLSRMVGDPASVFVLLGQHAVRAGWWTRDVAEFAAARRAAETLARAHAHPREVTLAEIYRQFAFLHGLNDAAAAACAARELELEHELLWAVPQGARCLADARRARAQVAFISDTYVPADTLQRWLTTLNVALPGERVWASSEAGDRKADGGLFRRVARELPGVRRWQHLGDHPVSDVEMPRRMGIEARRFTPCLLNRYETAMESFAVTSGGLASLLAGAGRWLRLSQPARSPAQEALRELAAGVAGPVLSSFVVWLLREAQRSGIRRLWFVARDGQVLLRMAQRLAERMGVDVELGYLYAGRQVVHLAGLQCVDGAALDWLTGGAGILPLQAVLERADLQPEDVVGAVQRHGLPREGVLGWEAMAALRAFFADAEVQALVLQRAAARRETLRAYYQSCGLIDGERCAVVDIGWRGSVLRSLFNVLGREQGARHRFLYFGLYARPADVPGADMAAYCFDVSGRQHFGTGHDIPSLTSVMEIFCQADHGPVLSVERQDGAFVPRLRNSADMPRSDWDVAFFQECLERYAAVLRLDLLPETGGDLRALSERLLRLLMQAPLPDEARILGGVQYVDDQGGTTAQPFAEAYRVEDWRASVRAGALPQKTLAWWTEGAWTLTPATVRLLLVAARRLGRARLRSA